MIWERLGVITDEISADFIEALDWLQAEGLKYAEIRMVDGINVASLTDEQAARAAREVAERGLRVSAVASPLFKCALDPSRPVLSGDMFGQAEESVEQHFAKLERTIDIVGLFGTRMIRIFSFWRERHPERYEADVVALLRRAAAVAEQRGALLLLENERSCNGGYADEVASLVRAVESPALKALWDPGNESQGERWSYPAVYEQVKHSIAHVHLKDSVSYKSGKSTCVPIGAGIVPYLTQIRNLEADGYQGLYVIETHYTPSGGTKMQGTKQSLEGLRRLLGHTPRLCERAEKLRVNVYDTRRELGEAAAEEAAAVIKELQSRQPRVRIVFAAAPSQNEFLAALAAKDGIDWSRVTAFHMDEYIGLSDDAPQKFSRFLSERLFDLVKPGELHLISGANEVEEECRRYGELISAQPIDLICLGIGENGHIAFNDPPVADFQDSETMKVVELDDACRQQQVNDGCFASFEDVPTHSLTLTIPAMMAGARLLCIVPGPAKRGAVRETLAGPVGTACPSTILRTHPDCTLFVDRESYGLTSEPNQHEPVNV